MRRLTTVSNLTAGDHVEVRGDEFPAGSVDILEVMFERADADTEVILQGFVETISDPSYAVLGVTIYTNGATIFRDVNDAVISAEYFFNQVGVNPLVKANGSEVSDTGISATEVEFELEL